MSKINIQIQQLSQDKIKFALTGCDVSLANSLRRVLISQVPTLAPHLVSVIENTSVLHDQFLVQRIGLIPFISDTVDKFKYPWQCDCSNKGSQDCQICKAYFVLQVKNVDHQVLQVTSLDIRPVFQIMMDEESNLRPVMPLQYEVKQNTLKHKKGQKIGIPIVKLSKNQQINVRFDVQKGIGKMHSKWAPVSLATYQPDPQIVIKEGVNITLNQKLAIRDSCPVKVFQVQGDLFQATNPQKCIFCGQCTKTAEQLSVQNLKNFITIGKKKERYIFTVESIGTLPPIQIVKKSFSVLRQKLKFLQQAISK